MRDLASLRKEINAIDAEIIPLLEKRFSLIEGFCGKKEPVEDLGREEEILSKISSRHAQIVYREIFRNAKEIFMSMDSMNVLQNAVNEAVRAAETLKTSEALTFMERVARMMVDCYSSGKKILVAGNGGSLCDAIHFAEELTGQFRKKRRALPAIALADPGHMSCVGNDMGFDEIFARAVEAHGMKGDLLVILTTSGNSPNVIKAVHQAKRQGLRTAAFLGKDGGALKGLCEEEWIVRGFPYSDRIQEAHMAAIHIILELVEKRLFSQSPNPAYVSASSS